MLRVNVVGLLLELLLPLASPTKLGALSLSLSQSFSLILSLFLTRSGALPSSLFFPELRMDAAAVVSVAAVSSGASSGDSSFRQLIN